MLSEKLCFLICVLLECDLVLFEKSQLIVSGVICTVLRAAECRFCFLLTRALLSVFFKPLWVLSKVSSSAVWDGRRRDAVFPSFLPVFVFPGTLPECQDAE